MPVDSLNRSNFSQYVFQPCSQELSREDQRIATLATVLLAFTLGVGHLICAIVYVLQSSCKKASKTDRVAQNQLNNAPAVGAPNNDNADMRNAILDKLTRKFKECECILARQALPVKICVIQIIPGTREVGIPTTVHYNNFRDFRKTLEQYKDFYDAKDFETASIQLTMKTTVGTTYTASLVYKDGVLEKEEGPKVAHNI